MEDLVKLVVVIIAIFIATFILSLPDKIQQSQNQQMIELLKEREKIK